MANLGLKEYPGYEKSEVRNEEEAIKREKGADSLQQQSYDKCSNDN